MDVALRVFWPKSLSQAQPELLSDTINKGRNGAIAGRCKADFFTTIIHGCGNIFLIFPIGGFLAGKADQGEGPILIDIFIHENIINAGACYFLACGISDFLNRFT